jgi:hypothetical protein
MASLNVHSVMGHTWEALFSATSENVSKNSTYGPVPKPYVYRTLRKLMGIPKCPYEVLEDTMSARR